VQHAVAPDRSRLDTELQTLLEASVNSLPRLQRLVITFRDIEGWTSEEVCEALNISAGNQRVVLHRARMRVRALLSPYFEAG
jgi:RNA polymerase sigma-70 factor, ECF subfamily